MSDGGATEESLPITVVIPAFNRHDTIARAVASALGQRPCPPGAVLVVDDASTDGTAEAAEAAGARVLRTGANAGPGAARNAGLRAADGEWVAFLDSDDVWRPGHLDRVWSHRDGLVLVAESSLGTSSGRVFGNSSGGPIALRSPADVLFPENPVALSAALVRRADALAAGGFAETGVAEDLDLWCRLLERGQGLALPDVGVDYHEHPAQLSADRSGMHQAVREIVRRYAGRPWSTPALRRSVLAVAAWDDLRAALRVRDRRGIRRALPPLLHPVVVTALPRLWRWRARSRGGGPPAPAGR